MSEGSAGLLDIEGGAVEYARFAPSARPGQSMATIVLLHEGLGSVGLWRDFPAALAERTGREVFAYSRHGYAGSAPAPLPRPVDFMHREARDTLPRILHAAGIEAHVLVGHSDGGSIAAIYAGSPKRQRPGLKALVLLAAHVFNEPRCIEGISAAATAFNAGSLRNALGKYHGERVDDVFRGWRDVWLDPAFASWNVERLLRSITCPTLVMQGRDDPYGTLNQVEAICRQVSGAVTERVLDHCGHSIHRDQPEALIEEIDRFVRRHLGE